MLRESGPARNWTRARDLSGGTKRDFVIFSSKFQLLSKKSPRHHTTRNSDSVFTALQKYVFNVHQIIASGGKFNISLAQARTKIRSQFTKTRHF